MKQSGFVWGKGESPRLNDNKKTGVSLGAAENFTLLMARSWVRALTSEKGSVQIHEALNIWNKGFCRIGDMGASKSFDHFMSLLARKSLRKLQIGCPMCKGPNSDEQRILNILASYQHGKVEKGRELLQYWLEGHDGQLAEHNIILFVAALNRQDYRFMNGNVDIAHPQAKDEGSCQGGGAGFEYEGQFFHFSSEAVH